MLFLGSIENGVLYSAILPYNRNVVIEKPVLLRNSAFGICDAYILDVGIKAALGYNPQYYGVKR
jgi:hypothetical protein